MNAASNPEKRTAGSRPRVLVVDDDKDLLRLLSIRLRAAGYRVGTAHSGEQALASLELARAHLVISDLRMEGMGGMVLLDNIRARYPTLPVIILTAHGTIPDAVQATEQGAYGFIAKPFDGKALLDLVAKALQLGLAGSCQLGDSDAWRAELISCNATMEDLINEAKLVAASDVSIAIHGENGTGKEVLAKAIHKASTRAERQFLAINCGAIPEGVLESELFGHKKGAFTGAVRDHKGMFQAAHGGTLLLDEIGDMPTGLQVRLLRVLQERQVRPVGSTQSVGFDVRIISSTHHNLEQSMEQGTFREDLYYRLNVVTLSIPPLRDRREDIPLLAQHFLDRVAAAGGREARSFSPDAMGLLINNSWPGNVRQLYNLVEQTFVLSTTPVIPAALVKKALHEKPGRVLSLADAKQRFERDYLVQLMQISKGNVAEAAKLAKRSRTDFYRLLNRHGLRVKLFKSTAANGEH